MPWIRRTGGARPPAITRVEDRGSLRLGRCIGGVECRPRHDRAPDDRAHHLHAYTPTLRKQIAALESGGHESPEYRAIAFRGRIVGIVLAIDVLVIVFLMVTEPTP
jgi:hypothetical protein